MALQLESTDVRRVRLTLGMSREALARVLDVSARSVERWEAGSAARDVDVLRRIDELAEIAALGQEAFGADLPRFMATPRRSLGRRTPAEALGRGELSEVRAVVAGIVEGQFA